MTRYSVVLVLALILALCLVHLALAAEYGTGPVLVDEPGMYERPGRFELRQPTPTQSTSPLPFPTVVTECPDGEMCALSGDVDAYTLR